MPYKPFMYMGNEYKKYMKKIFQEIEKEIKFHFPSATEFYESESGLKIEHKNGKIKVYYTKRADIARAALIIKSNGDNDYVIEENSAFDDVCLMIDCSRNAVRNVETVKKLIRNLAMIGYNSLMLYTEDTYEVDEEPIFGYLRGRYTKAEMKELDAYANELGIELIPCIQTLAHLNQLKRYQYSHFKCFDCSDILWIGEERTYQLIEHMFKTLSECYTTKKIHIGMDEAWLLGRGRYLDKNGLKPPFEIICSHLNKVCEIAEKYGLEPMIWSDMFWRIAYGDKDCLNENGKVVIPEKILNLIPKNVSLCHWDYHNLTPDGFTEKLEIHTQFKNPVWFAGGTAMDNRGFIPHLTYSTKIANAAITEAKKFNVRHLIETAWGDNGGECSVFSILPAVMHYSYTALGVGENRLKADFKALTGYDFEKFMQIEHAQTFCGKHTDDIANPAKYGLYNDVFLGYIDAVIDSEDKRYFNLAKSAIEDMRVGEYGYLFETAYDLNEVLCLKYDMGIRIRKAYQEKDKQKLTACVADMELLIAKLRKFIKSYRAQWLKENKPNGLEIQELRLGGLVERLTGCKERLEGYMSGEVDTIPELEEELLKEAISRTRNGNRCDLFSHLAIASVNSFDGFTEVDV